MNSPIVLVDCETTGLDRFYDHAWEFAAIRVDPDGHTAEYQTFISDHLPDRIDLLPPEFRADYEARYDAAAARNWDEFPEWSAPIFSGKPVLMACNPTFDVGHIAKMFSTRDTRYRYDEGRWSTRRAALPWHYRPVCVEALAVGYLAGRASRGDLDAGLNLPDFPWDSSAVSRAIGVDPDAFDRHTALGDCRWALAQYRAVMGS
ncbi:hypothetical protein KIH74_25485 [Kineosporia sp. J2-2]|uniref:Exonuclease domain-containing protein n=1 Tax=Kineosporia corallincola TaxID=2835133 RepID=A0ABS5TMJ0_9ACTN|nr:exonuclease domain-containing protein [Kineosporia corallincola]MBT0772323.1 hypothetical protein [Kineosporia corallincola]